MGHSLPKCFQISICLNSIGWNTGTRLSASKNLPNSKSFVLPHMAEARIAAGGDRYYQRNLQTQRTPKARLAAEPINKAPRSTYAFLL